MTGFLVKSGMELIPAWSCSQSQSRNSPCGWRGVTDWEAKGQRGQGIDWKLSISLELEGMKDKTTLLCSFGKKIQLIYLYVLWPPPSIVLRLKCDVAYRGLVHSWVNGKWSRKTQASSDREGRDLFHFVSGIQEITQSCWHTQGGAEFSAGADNQVTHIALPTANPQRLADRVILSDRHLQWIPL